MIRNNSSLQRQTFDMLQKKFPGKEVAPHFLRTEVVLKNNINKYKFDHRSVGGESSTEIKLDRNDLVYVTSILLGWIECSEGEEAVASIKTYAPAGSDLEALYNGFMSLKTGAKVNFEALSCQNFKYVPQQQEEYKTATLGPSGTTVQYDMHMLDQFNFMDAAYSGVEDIYLHGTKSHEITVEYPTKANMSVEPLNGERKLVLILNGFIIKNGADALNK